MINFSEIHIYARAAILLILLLLTTIDLYSFISALSKKKQLIRKIVLCVFSMITFIPLVYFSSLQNATVNSLYFDDYEFSAYIGAVILVVIANAVYLVWMFYSLNKSKNKTITASSVKESVDNLPTGLCFSKKNGMVQLVNYQMNKLSYLLSDSDIQNAETFWKLVSKDELGGGLERISSGDKPEIRFSDGKVWLFERKNLGQVIQITANDVTDYHFLTKTLKEKNTQLKNMNERLRKYGETVDEVTRSKERLETKVRIHSEFGQALIVTRHALQNNETDLTDVSEIWKRNIAVMRMEAEPASDADHLTTLMKAAESAGVKIEIKGKIPRAKETRLLVMSAATEALTNAVRHAQAKNLFIEIEERKSCFTVCFTNDGKIPLSDVVTEGGGLGSLRKKIERAGGEMYLSGSPIFALTVKLMKESGDMV